jgi:hypothetical protein
MHTTTPIPVVCPTMVGSPVAYSVGGCLTQCQGDGEGILARITQRMHVVFELLPELTDFLQFTDFLSSARPDPVRPFRVKQLREELQGRSIALSVPRCLRPKQV